MTDPLSPDKNSETTPILEIKNLTKRYRRLVAVDDLSLTVYPGDFIGFIGPNGAGKSTTMNCISGVLAHDAGSIHVAGIDVLAKPVEARKNIGFVPQELTLFGYLTGDEFLHFIATIRGLSNTTATTQIEELLTLTELTHARDRVLKEYSGGMARKIAICAALLGPPGLLLLDESFVGLDPESTYRIRRRLQQYCQQGGAIVLSSHILEMLQPICTRFIIMSHGKIARALTHTEFTAGIAATQYPDLTQLYLNTTGKNVDP